MKFRPLDEISPPAFGVDHKSDIIFSIRDGIKANRAIEISKKFVLFLGVKQPYLHECSSKKVGIKRNFVEYFTMHHNNIEFISLGGLRPTIIVNTRLIYTLKISQNLF